MRLLSSFCVCLLTFAGTIYDGMAEGVQSTDAIIVLATEAYEVTCRVLVWCAPFVSCSSGCE